MWIGTFGKGLYCYNKGNKTSKTYTNNSRDFNRITDDLIRIINVDSQKNINLISKRIEQN